MRPRTASLHAILLCTCFLIVSGCQHPVPGHSDNSKIVEVPDPRVEALLGKMTLEEKIGQMAQINITMLMTDSLFKRYDSVTAFHLDTLKLINFVSKFHIGSFLNGRGVAKESWLKYMDQLQRINMKYSRLKIPILYGVDHVHGSNYLKEGTVFPHNINIAATFDTSFAGEMARVTVYETSGLGHRWIFAPVMDIGRNKFWGRYYETFGEDPHLAAQMGAAYIHGIQDSKEAGPYKVAACAKHFLGYSDPKSGWDRSPGEIPDQILREFFLPPFKAAIDAGVKTVMVNSGELNGIPVHASHKLLTKLLREELGFKGVAVSDWLDIISLTSLHYYSENEKEGTYAAIMAGIDMSMIPLTTDFCRYMKELVQEGRIPEERINLSVRRILQLKYDLGLFDHPYPDASWLQRIGLKESGEKALKAARESIVLLKNEQVLPLKYTGKILVTGPTAIKKVPLSGGWTYRFIPRGDHWFPDSVHTIFQAVQKEFPKAEVAYATQAEVPLKAKGADVILLAIGEEEAYAETDGSINDLDLSPTQKTWADVALAQKKPTILILTEGRPRLLGNIYDRCNAVLFAGLPGNFGGTAVAEILSGKVNPSGKMSFTYPFRQGHVISYNHKRSEYSTYRPVSAELKRFALAEFGEGLSYTQFSYHDLVLSDSILGPDQQITAKVTVTNTGKMSGKEAVLWFISDTYGSITRPVKELAHFEKKEIAPGASKEFVFTINPSLHLSFPDEEGKTHLERGKFEVQVGDVKTGFRLK
jgi:beta-glucosidase